MGKRSEREPGGGRRFCSNCGTAAQARDHFCSRCGTALGGGEPPPAPTRGLLGLVALGIGIVALASASVFFLYGRDGSDHAQAPLQEGMAVGDPATAAEGTVRPLTPRGMADRLFNQAMAAHEAGDVVASRQFIPMAIDAYGKLADLDLDGRYHLALLNLAGERFEDALAQAEKMLETASGHILALTAAAQAQDRLGRSALAADLYQRLLDAYESELKVARSEYADHGNMLQASREEARRYLQEHGRAAQ